MESRVTGFCLIAYFVTVSNGRRAILAPSPKRADLQTKCPESCFNAMTHYAELLLKPKFSEGDPLTWL